MKNLAAFLSLALSTGLSLAQANSAAFVSIPVLDDLGLVGLSAAVALIGGIVARRRKK